MKKLYTILILLIASTAFGATTSSIEQWGITWTFDQAYEYGQFANGDYWVKTDPGTGYVSITGISPAVTTFNVGGTDYTINGWEVNPIPAYAQGFDQRAPSYDASRRPGLPFNASAGDSLIKVISRTNTTALGTSLRPAWHTAGVLTVVGSVPTDNGATLFRPPYVGTSKPLYSTSSIRWDRIPSYGPVANMPTLEAVASRLSYVQMSHIKGLTQSFQPSNSMQFYGANICQQNSDAIQRLLMNDSQAAKTPALIGALQGGIDYYHFFKNGQTWPAGGGEQPGRIILWLFAAYILDDTGMKADIPTTVVGNFPYEQYKILRKTPATPLYGQPNIESSYWSRIEGGAGSATSADPYDFIDGGGSPGGSYQLCCCSQCFKQLALIMTLVPGLQSLWSHSDVVIDYAERWVTFGAWTQPDPCAPYDGNPSNRGITYGPDGAGHCIKDPNLSYYNSPTDFACQAGKECGRFPARHGINVDGGDRYSNYAAALWDTYYDAAEPPPPPTCDQSPDACGTPQDCLDWWDPEYEWRDGSCQLKPEPPPPTCSEDPAACDNSLDCETYHAPEYEWSGTACVLAVAETPENYTYDPRKIAIDVNPIGNGWTMRRNVFSVSKIEAISNPIGNKAWRIERSGTTDNIFAIMDAVPAIETMEVLMLTRRSFPDQTVIEPAARMSTTGDTTGYFGGQRLISDWWGEGWEDATELKRFNEATTTLLASGTIPGLDTTGGKWIFTRLSASGTDIKVRLWDYYETEPVTWQHAVVDSTYSAGGAGFYTRRNDVGGVNHIAWFSVGIGGSAAPMPVAEEPPTCADDAGACTTLEDCTTHHPTYYWWADQCQVEPEPEVGCSYDEGLCGTAADCNEYWEGYTWSGGACVSLYPLTFKIQGVRQTTYGAGRKE